MRVKLLAESPYLLDLALEEAYHLLLALQPYLIAKKSGFACGLVDENGIVLDRSPEFAGYDIGLPVPDFATVAGRQFADEMRPGEVRRGEWVVRLPDGTKQTVGLVVSCLPNGWRYYQMTPWWPEGDKKERAHT